MKTHSNLIYEFKPYRLDSGKGQLFRSGNEIKLGRSLLELRVRPRGGFVPRDRGKFGKAGQTVSPGFPNDDETSKWFDLFGLMTAIADVCSRYLETLRANPAQIEARFFQPLLVVHYL
jgi:hypothetical protein